MPQEYAYLNDEAGAWSSAQTSTTQRRPAPLSVSAALGLAKRTLEDITLSIVGEISDLSDNPRYKAVYFTLADTGAALPCLMWRAAFERLGVRLKSGMQVEVRGRFSLYAAKGRMQFDVRELVVAGEGQLRARVAALAERLAAEGLMSASRKLPLPVAPEVLALVTSPRGKAVHDVLRTLRRRFPLTRVLLFGVAVEGRDAAAGMTQALAAAGSSEAEAILLVRGGGSYEDLMPFNDEALARAIAGSPTPVVTGIGHEPDTSIADMVASLRASTPTAAAEALVPDVLELRAALAIRASALRGGLLRQLERHRHAADALARSAAFTQGRFLTAERALSLEQTALRLDAAIPTGLKAARDTLDEAEQRLNLAGREAIAGRALALEQAARSLLHDGSTLLAPHTATLATAVAGLESLSPLAVLARGYALSYDGQGKLLRSVRAVRAGEPLSVRLADGEIDAHVAATRPYNKEKS
jgi:exodeoxyribonuclease VII large subunit